MRFLMAAGLYLFGMFPAYAETRALLIGVSHYDESAGIASLRGPANDVRLLRDTLAARGVQAITLLADGVEGGAQPTHAAILAAFAQLAATSRPGDLVFVSMSGHGTRQPDDNGDETDGLDEVFLPSDTGRAESGARAIPNALVDDEIGAAVTAIREAGADVFLVMDSCHSGSGLRAASPVSAARYVDPAALGLAGAEAPATAETSAIDDSAGDPPGGVIAFYAARSSEVAREVNLTPDADGDAGWYGLFTQRLAARIATSDGQSYRQLFQSVLSDLNDTSLPGGGPLQTPSWEGNLIDAAVFGGRATLGVRQFAVSRDEIAAGLVQGFGQGTVFTLVADAAAPAEAGLGFAQIEEVEATRGYLRLVDAGCEPRSDAPCASIGALPAAARFARLSARPVDLALRLAPLRDLATGQPVPAGDVASRALAAAVTEVNAAGGVRVETDAAAPDIEVAVQDGALWFGRRVAIGATPVGLRWHPDDGVPLAPLLARIAAAERLAILLGAAAEGGSILNPSPVTLNTNVQSSRVADLDPPGAGGNPQRECRRAQRAAEPPASLDLGDAPAFKQCDLLSFAVQGAVQGARDVNRVHIDSQFCVHAAHARVEDTRAATALGDPMVMCSDCPDAYAAGDERLFVIVTEAEANSDQLNLEGLVENCAGAAPTRGAADRAALDFLTALGHRPGTRGSFGGLALSDVWVSSFRWEVVPKEEVFARVKPLEETGALPASGP